MRVVWCMVTVLMTLSLTGCAGKRIPATFSEMGTRVPEGTTVYVRTTDGKEVHGTLGTVSGSSMTVSFRDRSTRGFREADVTEVRARDPLWNGMLIGAGVGALSTFALSDESCVEPYASPSCVKVSRGAGTAIGTVVGAALGTGFDVLHRRRVFRRASPGRAASLFIAPVMAPRRLGVRVSAAF